MQTNIHPDSRKYSDSSDLKPTEKIQLPELKEFKPTHCKTQDTSLHRVKIQYSEAKKETDSKSKTSISKSERTQTILQQIDQRLDIRHKPTLKSSYLEPQIVPVKIISYKYFVEAPSTASEVKVVKKQRKPRTLKRKLTIGFSLILIGLVIGFGTIFSKNLISSSLINPNKAEAAVLAATETPEDLEYKSWIENKNQATFSPKETDLDSDGLTNYEEFLLDTSPISTNTCSQIASDMQNLLNLTDPKSCQPINLNDENQFKKFSQVVNLGQLNEKLVNNTALEPGQVTNPDNASLLTIFGVQDLKALDKISVSALEQESQTKDLKIKYLKLIEKIDLYISKNRSYEIYDRDYETPVHAAKFLEVSLKYNIPVKYLLAIAKAESRFGTDRYTQSGNLTRPGEHHNIYSLGLTDSGSNVTFDSWEAGVDSMGKWWQKFDQKNVSIPRRLKIFNPNGDYPGKIEGLATQIENFINS